MNISEDIHVFPAFPKSALGVRSSGRDSTCDCVKYLIASKWQSCVLASLSDPLYFLLISEIDSRNVSFILFIIILKPTLFCQIK